MGRNSQIEWTHHTFNPWWGCSKVSAGCDHCYAEKLATRWGNDIWGPSAKRRFFSDAHWADPVRWNAEAEALGDRRRVFCASMSDVFEDRRDLDPHRRRLWDLIAVTPWLEWLLLTKRPQNVLKFVPWKKTWPGNVWVGTTVENETWAGHRIPDLLQIPSARRFLSCEPLIGPVDLGPYTLQKPSYLRHSVDWVIAGGESGPGARAVNPDWIRSLRDLCLEADIPFHFKQWGHWQPASRNTPADAKRRTFIGADGREFVAVAMGKKAAGRRLDGREWDGVPLSVAVA